MIPRDLTWPDDAIDLVEDRVEDVTDRPVSLGRLGYTETNSESRLRLVLLDGQGCDTVISCVPTPKAFSNLLQEANKHWAREATRLSLLYNLV